MRACRVDSNQKEIVSALRGIGCSVAVTSSAGDGFPDLVVGRTNLHGVKQNFLLEIKDGKKPPSKRRLEPKQIKLHSSWQGQIAVVTSVSEALNAVLNNRK